MPYEVEVVINDVPKVKLLYNEVHLYRFESESETDADNGVEITQMDSPPTNILNINYSTYIFLDAPGSNKTYWYRARYHAPVGVAPTYSCFSEPIRGGTSSTIFHNICYPDEIFLSSSDAVVVEKIRNLAGDRKNLIHDYMSTCQSRLSENKCTIEMQNKGWPLYISLNSVEMSSPSNPYIDGYTYLTFSGAIVETDVIDMYYYTFRNSDTEIYDAYSRTMIPAGLTTSTVTEDHLIIQTAVDILEAELWQDSIDSGARIREGDTTFDPSTGFTAREKAITRLRKRLDDLIKQYMLSGAGILID